jgi:Ser/Thr protein kinase RdoA (MazF antagonist)
MPPFCRRYYKEKQLYPLERVRYDFWERREEREKYVDQERLAHNALDAYSIALPKITFLRQNENMVFHVCDEQTGNTYLLRIHAPLTKAFQGERLHPEGIASELHWLEALTDETSLVLQRPIRTKEGALVAVIVGEQGNIPCSLLRWIEADPFPAIPLSRQVERLGMLIATLHTHARTWSVPESFTRPVYDLAFHRCQINTLVEGVHRDIIQEGDFACIQETLELILATLAETQESLILTHADLWRGNLLVSQTDIHLIDFSLCGFGSPLFDLGTCLPGIPANLRLTLLHAYQQQELLPSISFRLIDAYFLLSRMGAYVYLLANVAEHDWLKERIPRFVAQECRLFLEEKALLLGGPF